MILVQFLSLASVSNCSLRSSAVAAGLGEGFFVWIRVGLLRAWLFGLEGFKGGSEVFLMKRPSNDLPGVSLKLRYVKLSAN